jgi:uncharacterized protein (TIGR01244 family)
MKRLDSTTLVSGQIAPEEIAALGVSLIVNNRMEGEEPGQPTSAEMEGAAAAAGVAYLHIPVAGGFSEGQVEAMREALESTEGQVLAFCKSGTRSAYLWALARARMGDDAGELIRKGAGAGYDLRPLLPYLTPR